MDDTSSTTGVDRQPADEVFGLLGDETRVAILQALGETIDEPVPFSTLRERVGTADSGRFNYHLSKLSEHFVRKQEAGYELTYAGRQLVGALLAGTYTASATVDPIPMAIDCPECGGEVVAEYVDEHAEMHCTACDEWQNVFPFPPGAIEGFDREALPVAFDRWLRLLTEQIQAGFCPNCVGHMTGELVIDGDDADGPHITFECEGCGESARFSVLMPLLFHTRVECFLLDRGIDVREYPLWAITARIDKSIEVAGTDPPRVALGLSLDDHRVAATLEADLTLTDLRTTGDVSD